MTDLNVFHHLATLPDHEGSFKRLKKAFLNDQKGIKMRFSGFRIDGSTWHCIWWWNYMFSTNWQHHQVMKDHSITIKNIFGWSKEPINRILAISSSLLHLIDLILHTLIFLNDLLKFVKSLVIVLHLMRRLKDWSWACPYRTLQFSTSVEVRPGNVRLSVNALSEEPYLGFSANLVWS